MRLPLTASLAISVPEPNSVTILVNIFNIEAIAHKVAAPLTSIPAGNEPRSSMIETMSFNATAIPTNANEFSFSTPDIDLITAIIAIIIGTSMIIPLAFRDQLNFVYSSITLKNIFKPDANANNGKAPLTASGPKALSDFIKK